MMIEAGLPDNLVTHFIAGDARLPAIRAVRCEYVMTETGVMVRARRDGLEVCLPVAVSPSPIVGLPEVEPYVQLAGGRVPAGILSEMLERARAVCRSDRDADFLESLFYLRYGDETASAWEWSESEQIRRHSAVRPVEDGEGSSYAKALVEIHTHPKGFPHFSPQDDDEESGKFRIFVIFSDLFGRTRLRVRVGVFDHFCEIPADWVFELPAGLTDSVTEELTHVGGLT